MRSEIWWFLARASGLVSLCAMAASLVVGLVLSTRLFPRRRRPAWLLEVHRWFSGIAVLALAGHLVSLVADSYVHFDVIDLILPFAASWRPGRVAIGVASLWLLGISWLAASLRRRLPRRGWLWAHRTSYLSFWLASLHAATIGTDAGNRLYRVVAVLLLTIVTAGAVYRVSVTEGPARLPRSPRPGSAPPATPVPPADPRPSELVPLGPPLRQATGDDEPNGRPRNRAAGTRTWS